MYIHVVTHDSMAPTLTVLSILPPRWSWRTRAVRLASRRFHLLSHLPSVYRMVTVTGCPRPSAVASDISLITSLGCTEKPCAASDL